MTTITLWGARGSLATPGPETSRYGGNTSCVEVRGDEGTVLILDAGTGIRRLGAALERGQLRRVDLLLTHLHMDHIQGLGFFAPLYDPDVELHIWGPASTTLSLQSRIARYLSPPLFPVRLREVSTTIHLHEVCRVEFDVGEFHISTGLVCHPGPTVGYRIASAHSSLAYLPDHEPALGLGNFPLSGDWTSGYSLAAGADLLIHDAQYSNEEYSQHVGWGHSSLNHALKFAKLAGVGRFVPFHHDPDHDDVTLDQIFAEAVAAAHPSFAVTPGTEGAVFELAS
ncbi:MAG: MBL fold metallo-hydrolase [Chloroflexi bacterium]|nr:MBL fold metallo-hydrolase [Chloroflexota bacterium]MCI0577754.1 MBL fold metallo-hydrolase [Chloroflexota bacterium]MCI0644660.1 MBL fold metallo-hydrolase [Chloroflexota bacterium]MCI0728044.1 MBL fold metallo-hydrolase [Chloroflexota bacterium]